MTPLMRLYTLRFLFEHPSILPLENRAVLLAGIDRDKFGEIERPDFLNYFLPLVNQPFPKLERS